MNEANKPTTTAPLHGIVLLPCPFCGESAVKLKHNDIYRIRHLDTCWFSGKDFSQRASLIEPDEVDEWNNRVRGEFICDQCSLRQDARPKVDPQF
jgi:hypothetical protein